MLGVVFASLLACCTGTKLAHLHVHGHTLDLSKLQSLDDELACVVFCTKSESASQSWPFGSPERMDAHNEMAHMVKALSTPPHSDLFVVQLKTASLDTNEEQLRKQIELDTGVSLGTYIPFSSYLTHTTLTKAQHLSNHQHAAWVGRFPPRAKISRFVQRAFEDFHKQPNNAHSLSLQLSLLPGSAPCETTRWGNMVSGTEVRCASSTKLMISGETVGVLTAALTLAATERVVWVDVVRTHIFFNKWAGPLVSAGVWNETKSQQCGAVGVVGGGVVDGKGELVGCADTGLDVDHCYFWDDSNPRIAYAGSSRQHRKVVSLWPFGDSTDSSHGHGTHVVGTILGSPSLLDCDSEDCRSFRGIAPAAKVVFTDVGVGSSNELTMPDTLQHLFDPAYAVGARVFSASWGSPTPVYTTETMEADKFLRENMDALVIVAAGNDGARGLGSVSSPCTCKSCLCVGASQNTAASFERSGWNVQLRVDHLDDVFEMRGASFGPVLSKAGSRPLVLAEPIDACDTLVDPQAVSGSVVFVLRGTCTFTAKVLACQAAGAAAVVVGDNADNPGPPLLMGPSSESNEIVTIPSAFVTFNTANKLQQELQEPKNITVSFVEGDFPMNNHTNLASFSSRGPAFDGRIKPDVVAPGQLIYSVDSDGVPHSYQCGTIAAKQGTSMATPLVAGAALLVRQYCKEHGQNLQPFHTAFSPSGALVKALIVHSARSLGGSASFLDTSLQVADLTVPNVHEGFGLVNVANVLPGLQCVDTRASAPNTTDFQNSTESNISATNSTTNTTTAQNTTAQNATLQNTTLQNMTAQNTTAQNTTAQNTTAQNTTAQNITAQNITAQNTTVQNGSFWNATVQNATTFQNNSAAVQTNTTTQTNFTQPFALNVFVADFNLNFSRQAILNDTKSAYRTCFRVNETSSFRATLAWFDVPSSPAAALALVNDLDLVVVSQDGNFHFPNGLPNSSAGDRTNTVEHVSVDGVSFVSAAVLAHAIRAGDTQPFALVVSGEALMVANCTDFDAQVAVKCASGSTWNRTLGICMCGNGCAGPTCSLCACPSGCSGHGVCVDNHRCSCDPGYFGEDCAVHVCVDGAKVALTEPRGTIDTNTNTASAPVDTLCMFSIAPSGFDAMRGDVLVLSALELSVSGEQSLVVWEGDFVAGPVYVHGANSNSPTAAKWDGVTPLYFASPNISIVFDSGATAVPMSRISLQYEIVSCPNNCGEHGRCVESLCICEEGWNGPACEKSSCLGLTVLRLDKHLAQIPVRPYVLTDTTTTYQPHSMCAWFAFTTLDDDSRPRLLVEFASVDLEPVFDLLRPYVLLATTTRPSRSQGTPQNAITTLSTRGTTEQRSFASGLALLTFSSDGDKQFTGFVFRLSSSSSDRIPPIVGNPTMWIWVSVCLVVFCAGVTYWYCNKNPAATIRRPRRQRPVRLHENPDSPPEQQPSSPFPSVHSASPAQTSHDEPQPSPITHPRVTKHSDVETANRRPSEDLDGPGKSPKLNDVKTISKTRSNSSNSSIQASITTNPTSKQTPSISVVIRPPQTPKLVAASTSSVWLSFDERRRAEGVDQFQDAQL